VNIAPVAVFFAAQLTTWEKLKHVPKDTWINLVICVLAIVIIVRLWHALKKLNDFAPYIFTAIALSGIMAYWVYERTEPAFLTPFVEPLTGILPTKAKHQRDLERLRKSRDGGDQ
jgi:hypothetical protein